MGPSLGSIVALDSPPELPPPVVGTHVQYGSAWCMATIQTTEREQKEREEREMGLKMAWIWVRGGHAKTRRLEAHGVV